MNTPNTPKERIEEIVEDLMRKINNIDENTFDSKITFAKRQVEIKEAISFTLHQQLQKAREEERERIITILDDYEIDGEWQRNEMLRKIIADIAEINYTDLGKSSL